MQFERIWKIPFWRFIGPAIVVLVIWWAGPKKVWEVLANADLRFVAAAWGMGPAVGPAKWQWYALAARTAASTRRSRQPRPLYLNSPSSRT